MSKFKRHKEQQINADNIWQDDVFQTLEKYANFLGNALTANTKNFVLNVNGSWGTGKTFFVKRWAEDLRQKNYPVVEFNAWKNDSAEDSLAPLIATMLDQQRELLPEPLAKKMKDNCGKFLLAGGGLIVRAGLKHLVGEKGVDEVNKLLSSGAENELIKLAGGYVDQQLEKQKASNGLKNVLAGFVEEIRTNESHELPIFIFIDELDRCRPTFAIELLERVKHLFDIGGIKFIISTDTAQLIHSIKSVYGNDFDATTYLQRFFDETFTLPNPDSHQFSKLLFKDFDFEKNQMELWIFKQSLAYTFGELSLHIGLTLRQQLQAHHRIIAVVENTPIPPRGKVHFIFICILIMMRLKHPDQYNELMTAPLKKVAWGIIKKQNHFYGEIFKLVDEYFSLMDFDYEGVCQHLKKCSVKARSQREDDLITLDICRSCESAFEAFKKYPQLVELTETIS